MNARKIKSLHNEAKGGIFVGDDFPALRLAQADLLSDHNRRRTKTVSCCCGPQNFCINPPRKAKMHHLYNSKRHRFPTKRSRFLYQSFFHLRQRRRLVPFIIRADFFMP